MKDIVRNVPTTEAIDSGYSAIDRALNDGREMDLLRQAQNNRKPRSAKPDAHKKSAGTNQVA